MWKTDKTTPAWYGAETGHCVPLDISNPDVVDWMVETFVEGESGAIDSKMDAVALDDFDLDNSHEAAGVFTSDGVWIEKWKSNEDWTESVLFWLERFYSLVDSRLAVIPNFTMHAGSRAFDDPSVLRLCNASDAHVDESGFHRLGGRTNLRRRIPNFNVPHAKPERPQQRLL